jgi:adenylylsulfate kinase-like enzyme
MGLYARVKAGAVANFTSPDGPYEASDGSDIHLHTVGQTPDHSARMLAYLRNLGLDPWRPARHSDLKAVVGWVRGVHL